MDDHGFALKKLRLGSSGEALAAYLYSFILHHQLAWMKFENILLASRLLQEIVTTAKGQVRNGGRHLSSHT